MTVRLFLRLTGENAKLGEILASDLALVLSGVDRVVSRTAAQIAGRAPGKGGRIPQMIVDATKLRFVDVKEGSLVLELAPPEEPSDQEALELDDVQLADSAINTVIDVLEGSETGFPEAAAVLSQLAGDLDIGGRYETLALTRPGEVPREAVMDATARSRLSVAVQPRTRSDDGGSLVGILYEADFEKNSARLRTPLGDSVTVRFDDIHAQTIKEALREHAQFQGTVTYNEATSAIISVDIARIKSLEQLGLIPKGEDFWDERSVDELAAEQGVGVVQSFDGLRFHDISDEEAEAFIEALGL